MAVGPSLIHSGAAPFLDMTATAATAPSHGLHAYLITRDTEALCATRPQRPAQQLQVRVGWQGVVLAVAQGIHKAQRAHSRRTHGGPGAQVDDEKDDEAGDLKLGWAPPGSALRSAGCVVVVPPAVAAALGARSRAPRRPRDVRSALLGAPFGPLPPSRLTDYSATAARRGREPSPHRAAGPAGTGPGRAETRFSGQPCHGPAQLHGVCA